MDSSKLPSLLTEQFGQSQQARMVGRDNRSDSGYKDIMRFFGADAPDPYSVRINYLPEEYQITDPLIAEFASDMAARMRSEGRLRPGPPAMKLVNTNFASEKPSITVQPVDYALQAATCLSLDVEHSLFDSHGGTLRHYYLGSSRDRTIESNPLAICLGVCGWLLIEDEGRNYLLQMHRGSNVLSLENTQGTSVAGIVDYSTDFTNLGELAERELAKETIEEVDLVSKEFAITPLAWAIEIFRGERPQLFCLIRTTLDCDAVRERLQALPPERQEFDCFSITPLYGGNLLDRKRLDELNVEARMNYLLWEEYFEEQSEQGHK